MMNKTNIPANIQKITLVTGEAMSRSKKEGPL